MNHINTYQDINSTSEILGASASKHITLLLDKLLANMKNSILAIEEKNISNKCKLLTNSYDIVLYFIHCLDFQADPQMAEKLDGIYKHLHQLIFWANAKNDISKLNEATFIIENLVSWWRNVNESNASI